MCPKPFLMCLLQQYSPEDQQITEKNLQKERSTRQARFETLKSKTMLEIVLLVILMVSSL